MGQDDVLEYLKKNPRKCSREIAIAMDECAYKISKIISKLLKNKEVISHDPTDEEISNILDLHPSSIRGLYKLRVYSAK